MLAIVVKFFVLSECVSVCVLFFFSMGHVPEINGDDDDEDDMLVCECVPVYFILILCCLWRDKEW